MEETEGSEVEQEETETNVQCSHEAFDQAWLPIFQRKTKLTLAPHPYCHKCGIVRNVGRDRPRKIGYYMDVLSELEDYLEKEASKGGKNKLTECQKRLITKDIQKEEIFHDLYGTMASTQEEKFIEIVQKYRPDIQKQVIEYHLY